MSVLEQLQEGYPPPLPLPLPPTFPCVVATGNEIYQQGASASIIPPPFLGSEADIGYVGLDSQVFGR